MELQWISHPELEFDPDAPRTVFDQGDLLALGQNIKEHGQHVPLIVYQNGPFKRILDGIRRAKATLLVDIEQVLCLVLPEKPDASQLRIIQLSLEVHKVGLSNWERSCALKVIKNENRWSLPELIAHMQMTQSVAYKLLSCQRLDKSIQESLHSGTVDLEKAFIISQEPDFERQREIFKLYGHLPREPFRRKLRQVGTAQQPKAKRAKFQLPGGPVISVQGSALTLADAIESLIEVVKHLKRAQSQNLDIVRAQRFLKTKARTNCAVVEEDQPTR